jgi:hypothetical protein
LNLPSRLDFSPGFFEAAARGELPFAQFMRPG